MTNRLLPLTLKASTFYIVLHIKTRIKELFRTILMLSVHFYKKNNTRSYAHGKIWKDTNLFERRHFFQADVLYLFIYFEEDFCRSLHPCGN